MFRQIIPFMPSHIIAVAAVAALFGILSRLSPYKPLPDRVYPPHAELQRRFYWLPIPLALPVFGLLALWTFAEGRFLISTNRERIAPHPNELIFLPDNSWWYLVAALGGLWFSIDGGFWLSRKILGDHYDDYIHWNLTNTKFDTRPFLRYLGITAALLSIWLSIEGSRVFFRFTSDHGAWRKFRGAEVHFACKDIAELMSAEGAIAPNGDYARGRDISVKLRSGEIWHSRVTLLHEPDETRDVQFAGALASQCGLNIVATRVAR